MEKQQTQDTTSKDLNKKSLQQTVSAPDSALATQALQSDSTEIYEEKIPESRGDLADQAEIEIEQEIQEQIFRIRQKLNKGTQT